MAHHATIDKVDNHLKYAEQIAAHHNARLTPIRRHVYKCLLMSDAPIGAYQILDMLDGVGAAKPPTVYRALDWLIDLGLAKKIESISKYMAKTSQEEAQQLALLLCKTCGHAEPFDAGPVLESIGDFAKSKGFQKDQTVIEIIGQCSEHRT
jgi:Fur family zinc uptake transcriptional regulator